MSDAFDDLSVMLKARSGLMLGPGKQYLLETRLGPLMQRESLRDLRALADRVLSHPGCALERDVVEAMTTGETLFFRDEKPFAHLVEKVLPRLHCERPLTTPLRLWSAAASSGQEAYSLDMLLADSPYARRPARILGTDISREKIARARVGLYSQFEVQRGLSSRMLDKHFVKEGSSWRVSNALSATTEFRTFNLLDDLQMLGTFDVVFCRNLLIYFDPPTKAQVLNSIAGRMAHDAVLYLGSAETALGLTDRLVARPCGRGAYQLA